MTQGRWGFRQDNSSNSSSGNSGQGETPSSSQPVNPQVNIEPQSVDRGIQEQISPQSIEFGHVINQRNLRM